MSHQKEIDAINAKYSKYDPTDKKVKLQKHQELARYNKKHKLKPFVVLENFFISTPIFLIIFRVITISRPIKFTTLFGLWNLSKTPFKMIFNHLTEDGWLYLILCMIIIPVNFLSQKINTILSRIRNPHLKKKSNQTKGPSGYNMAKVQKIMTVVFLLFTFFWSTSLAIYYFFNSIFTIFQNLLIHYILLNRSQKMNKAQLQLQKLGLDV